MRERTEMMNGSFQLITALGAGTQVTITIPIQRNGFENQEKSALYGTNAYQKEA
jgi:hypothetical protein